MCSPWSPCAAAEGRPFCGLFFSLLSSLSSLARSREIRGGRGASYVDIADCDAWHGCGGVLRVRWVIKMVRWEVVANVRVFIERFNFGVECATRRLGGVFAKIFGPDNCRCFSVQGIVSLVMQNARSRPKITHTRCQPFQWRFATAQCDTTRPEDSCAQSGCMKCLSCRRTKAEL